MKKKTLLLSLLICTISLVGCSKKEEWNQGQESLGNIEIESIKETNTTEEISTEVIMETSENIEQETTSETLSGMTMNEILAIPDSEGDLTNEDFRKMLTIKNNSEELEVSNYYCYKASTVSASGTLGGSEFTNVKSYDNVYSILEIKNKSDEFSTPCKTHMIAYDKQGNILGEDTSSIVKVFPNDNVCQYFQISCDYAYDIAKIDLIIEPTTENLYNFLEEVINENIISSSLIKSASLEKTEEKNMYTLKVIADNFKEYSNYFGSVYHELLIFNKDGQLVYRDEDYDTLIESEETIEEKIYISEKYSAALDENNDELSYKLYTYIEIESNDLLSE